jgi:hypothetical protein
MKTLEMKNKSEVTEFDIKDFTAQFVPFGSLDIGTAISTAKAAGYDADWAAEQALQFMEETDTKIDDVDIVYCVYESILQLARNEISELIDYDFLNDAKSGYIETYGNYMATDYDYKEEAKDELVRVLGKNNVVIEDLSENTQYFLDQLGISQADINKKKSRKRK